MAIFSYARADGTQGTIEAADPNTALKMLPKDADPHSGVQIENGTSSSLPSLPGGGGPTDTPVLPGASTSPLLAFANSLNQAVNLAKEHRNASSLDMMKPFQGTAAASDFGAILSKLNDASDTSSNDLIKKAGDLANPKILSVSDAKALGVPYGTTEAEAAAKGIVPKPESADILVHSGNLTYTRTDYADDASALEQSRGTDNYVDPTVYQQLYDAWVAKGGKISDFIATYPPDKYVNPDNDWLPTYLRPKNTGGSNPFATTP